VEILGNFLDLNLNGALRGIKGSGILEKKEFFYEFGKF
jgi:hypothetical protein